MKYFIATKLVTEPKHSVDGKRHVKTLYYAGSIKSPFGDIVQWGKKRDAVAVGKREANKLMKRWDDSWLIEAKEA